MRLVRETDAPRDHLASSPKNLSQHLRAMLSGTSRNIPRISQMLTRSQIKLVKMAQREIGLSDADYRDCWRTVAGVSSAKDPRITDEQFDSMLSYLEAIAARSGAPASGPAKIFRTPSYWRNKNTKAESSRDRYARARAQEDIAQLENKLLELGYFANYAREIKHRVLGDGPVTVLGLHKYRSALQRTIDARATLEPQMDADGRR
jgi:hypothetical protein